MAISARIEELERKFNENPRRYFAPLANEYRKAGDLTQAISICRTYVPQQPAHMSGHIVFGQALFEAGEFEEARGVFESALQLDPENLIALRHLGDIARERGELTAARTWYRRVLDADPRNAEVSGLLSSIDGLPDAQAQRQSSQVEALSGWQDINPERTLELPPTLATPTPPTVEASAPTPVLTPRVEPRSGPIEGFFSGESDLEEMKAAPPPAAEDGGMGSGFETMEFQAPKREEHPAPPPVESTPESDTPQAFVTETMAELYLQQGFRDEALAVYRQLLAQNPYDDNLRERVAQLESGSRSSVSVASVSDSVIDAAHERRNAPMMRSVRAFFGGLAARRVVMHHAAAEPVVAEPVVAEPAAAEPVAAEPVVAQPVANESAEPVAAEPVAPEPVAAEHAVDEPIAAEEHVEHVTPEYTTSHADESYSDDAFGGDAFTGSFTPRASGGILAKEDYGGESLVSRVTEEVDVFGLPVRTEQSEPEPEPEPEPRHEQEAPAPHSVAPSTEPTPEPEPVAPAAPRNSGQTDASVNGLFADASVPPSDEAAASTLASAFGGSEPAPPPERAVRQAKNELSLDTVFREGPGESNPARRESSAFSFDQFFGSDTNTENVSPIEGVVGNSADDNGGTETEQFSSWLSGLKKK
jgi:tetratricopeptide (TPR) repeat protein